MLEILDMDTESDEQGCLDLGELADDDAEMLPTRSLIAQSTEIQGKGNVNRAQPCAADSTYPQGRSLGGVSRMLRLYTRVMTPFF